LLELKRVTPSLRFRHLLHPFALEQLAMGYVSWGQAQRYHWATFRPANSGFNTRSAPRVQQVVCDEALPGVSFAQPSAYTARISSVLPRAFIAPAIPSILEV
jgi:hypothetical protein